MNPRHNITVPQALYRRLVALAAQESRSLSRQVVHLVRLGLAVEDARREALKGGRT
jgi:hypothetical protein